MKGSRWGIVAAAAAAVVLITPATGAGRDASVPLAWSRGGVTIRSYAFATLASGSRAATRFRLTNWGRNTSGRVAIHLTGSSAFSISSNRCAGKNLDVRKWCRVTVVYAPRGVGARDRAVLTAWRAHKAAATLDLSGCTDRSGHVYWADPDGGTVNKSQLAGRGCVSTITTLAGGPRFAGSVAVDATHVYWTAGGKVKKVPIGGGKVTTLASGQGAAERMVVHGAHVYWVSFHSGYWDDGTVNEVSVNGGTVTTLASDQGRVWSLAADATHVYWVNLLPNHPLDEGTVSEVPVGGGSVTTLASGQNWPGSVALDATHVYWTSVDGGTLNEVPKGGGTVTTLVSGPSGLWAIVVHGGHIYWVNSYDGTVNEVAVGGGSVTTLASGLDNAVSLAVDGTHVYWSQNGARPAYVGALKAVPIGGGPVRVVARAPGSNAPLAVGP